MISAIDHIGLAVSSLDTHLPFYRDQLHLTLLGIEEVPSQQVRVAIFALGEARLELLEPTSPQSPVAKFLESRGEGIHHFALRTEHIGDALTHLQTSGCRLIDQQPRPGAHGTSIAFIHPKASGNALIELVQQAT